MLDWYKYFTIFRSAYSLVNDTLSDKNKITVDGVDYYFTCQYLKQFQELLDGVKDAGVSYMLLAGTEKDNFKMLKEECGEFQLEELLQMDKFHSFNIVKSSKGDVRLISKLTRMLER